MAPNTVGSYTILKLLLSHDPAHAANANVIGRWAAAAWRSAGPMALRKGGDPSAAMLKGAMKAAIAAAETDGSWNASRGPAGGAVRTAKRIGWEFRDAYTVVNDLGDVIDIGISDPRSVRDGVARATDRAAAKQVARHEKMPHLAGGIWIEPVRAALRSKSMSPGAKACFRRAFAGGYWSNARRFAAGIGDSAGCDCGADLDDAFHRIYECPRSQHVRDQHLSEQVKGMAAATTDRGSPALTRGLMQDPSTQLPRARDEQEEHWLFPRGERPRQLSGNMFIDGSALFPTSRAARRAGWTALQLGDDGEIEAAVYGPVPRSIAPGQAASAGELYGLRRAAELRYGESRLLTDYQGAVDGNRKGEAKTTAHSAASAAAWRGYWRAADGEPLNVVKVEAHRSAKSAREDEHDEEAMFKKRGNDAADELAKKGAACHHAAAEMNQLEDYTEGENELKGLVKLIGSALALWPPAPRRKKRPQDAAKRRKAARLRRARAAGAHGHRLTWSRNGWTCATCGKGATSNAGKRRLKLAACTGHNAARVIDQGHAPSAHVLWAAEADPAATGQAGPDVVWCSRCGGYSSTRLYKLAGPCAGHGDPPARTRLARLNALRHPVHGYGLRTPVRLTDAVITELRIAGKRHTRTSKGCSAPQSLMAPAARGTTR